ncbi:hypothetical protein KSF_064960 [Reticulibacter mediterranei]|uniref:Uncharacterized protein n=1 Tax=Reticulibacter mediterranei TaxID=2778369 RepID=A0A8J3IPX1_9CHLR|nr:hypothetical protein [Reticulibacter mediterranei]GHO96448.1 hypothetical protein KSF_064960 [Reticulibacter mediterranei]
MAQTIVCINNAGMIMQFWIEWVNDDGTQGWTQANSGDYPVDQRRSLDMDALNSQGESIPPGRLVRPHVQAVAGASIAGDRYITYTPGSGTAIYDVTGTSFNYSVTLIQS